MRQYITVIFLMLCIPVLSFAQQKMDKPRILISTDIGGTDPDDNQSMIHFLMCANEFATEGLVSSPSYGKGSKQSILEMIDLYEQDLPKLQQAASGYPSAESLRAITKQGRRGAAPLGGFQTATEGSDWIVTCARKKRMQPLWILVWGGLDDLAQALHDAPDISTKIKVYWIGGPNKKWSTNSYAYIANNFPDLWFIENNASYNGFFSDKGMPDSVSTDTYYQREIRGAGHMGKAFARYYGGRVKMGDTPSLLYLLHGQPQKPGEESWGGSFKKISHSPRTIFHGTTSIRDTVTIFSILEFHFAGPVMNIPRDSACFTMVVKAGIGEQSWEGFYTGNGDYVVRYAPKQSETVSYALASGIPGLSKYSGSFVVNNEWPGRKGEAGYPLGKNWYSDRDDIDLYDGRIQGGLTIKKWRNDALKDWAARWAWLR